MKRVASGATVSEVSRKSYCTKDKTSSFISIDSVPGVGKAEEDNLDVGHCCSFDLNRDRPHNMLVSVNKAARFIIAAELYCIFRFLKRTATTSQTFPLGPCQNDILTEYTLQRIVVQ